MFTFHTHTQTRKKKVKSHFNLALAKTVIDVGLLSALLSSGVWMWGSLQPVSRVRAVCCAVTRFSVFMSDSDHFFFLTH